MKSISQKTVKTRKDHNCWGCTKMFPAGTEMLIVTCEDAGKIASAYWCGVCSNFADTLPRDECEDGFDYGDLLLYDEYPDNTQPCPGDVERERRSEMRCNNCGANMIHMDIHKNDGVTRNNYKVTWKPETYVCEECDDVIYI